MSADPVSYTHLDVYKRQPATMLITKEIGMACGKTKEEQEFLISQLTPPYVIAGMASVTSLSIIIAGIMVNFL